MCRISWFLSATSIDTDYRSSFLRGPKLLIDGHLLLGQGISLYSHILVSQALTMVNTVAILGPSGLLGSHLLPVFGRLQAEGKLKLILIHRPTSILDVKQASVAESRILNMATATEQDIQTAMQGVDVLV